jgi:hypothetical protein
VAGVSLIVVSIASLIGRLAGRSRSRGRSTNAH